MSTPLKPRNRSLSIIGFGAFALVSLLFLAILLDSTLHTRLPFNWFDWFILFPFFSLTLVICVYFFYKAVKSPRDERPLTLGKRIILLCLFMLFLVLPVAGIWSIVNEVATCREVKTKGKEALAKVEYVELNFKVKNTREVTVQTPQEANEVDLRLKFTAEGTAIDYSPSIYLPTTDAIARVWSEAQTGTLKVRYLPGDPHTFFVAAAPCRESVFAIFQ